MGHLYGVGFMVTADLKITGKFRVKRGPERHQGVEDKL